MKKMGDIEKKHARRTVPLDEETGNVLIEYDTYRER